MKSPLTPLSLKGGTRLLVLVLVTLCLGGCVRGCTSSRPPIHLNPNMDNQPKYRPQAASDFFYDGASMRLPVEGTVARGELREDVAFYEGRDEAGEYVTANPLTVDDAVLERGRERYEIYCTPCHASNGNGKGVLWDRAQIEAGDLSQDRLVQASDGELFDVITNGLGLMQGYRYPIPTDDRWAIVAHVRELQAGRR